MYSKHPSLPQKEMYLKGYAFPPFFLRFYSDDYTILSLLFPLFIIRGSGAPAAGWGEGRESPSLLLLSFMQLSHADIIDSTSPEIPAEIVELFDKHHDLASELCRV